MYIVKEIRWKSCF